MEKEKADMSGIWSKRFAKTKPKLLLCLSRMDQEKELFWTQMRHCLSGLNKREMTRYQWAVLCAW